MPIAVAGTRRTGPRVGHRAIAVAVGALAVGALAVAGCAAPAADEPAADTAASTDQVISGDLVVFAAASLQDTFTELGDMMMAEYPDLSVTFSFGASSALAQQLVSGAPADVVAMASTPTMDAAADVVGEAQLFAANTLQIAVPAGNPGDVTGLADLTDPDLAIALCAVEVPCGSAAAAVFEAAGLTPAPDTYEPTVSAVMTKVVLGEVDAAMVYRTDVTGAGDAVEGIDVPEAADVVNQYPIATLLDAPNPAAAGAFVALVLSPAGQQVLADAGFDTA